MNKTTLTSVAIVIVIIAGYLAFGKDIKPANEQAVPNPPAITGQSTPPPVENTNAGPPIAEPYIPPMDPNVVTAEFEYKKDSVYEAKVVQAQEGQTVILKVTADIADEAHLHGYNVSKPTKPGETIVLDVTAKKSGRFELELEKIKKPLGYLEVYPK